MSLLYFLYFFKKFDFCKNLCIIFSQNVGGREYTENFFEKFFPIIYINYIYFL